MNLPKQTRPERRQTSTSPVSNGIAPSDCGCPIKCIGGCVFGRSLGYCL